MKPDEKLTEIIVVPKTYDDHYLVIATEKGLVKKTKFEEYKNVKASGIRAIKVNDDDRVLGVRVTDGKKDILICADSGKVIRFAESDCRPMGRVSQGVKGISLDENERAIGMCIIEDGMQILSVTEKGYGKRSEASEYRKQSRGGKGIIAMKLTAKTGNLSQMKPVEEQDDLMIITNKGQVIRTKISGISLLGRNTQGVRLINLKDGESVVAVEKIADSDED